jgi:hypothetical protein
MLFYLLLLLVAIIITTSVVPWWVQWQPHSWQITCARFVYWTGLGLAIIGLLINLILVGRTSGMALMLLLYPLVIYHLSAFFLLIPILLGKSCLSKQEKIRGIGAIATMTIMIVLAFFLSVSG